MFTMEKDKIIRWDFSMYEWTKIAEDYLKSTTKCIVGIKTNSTKKIFEYNWVLIGQIWLDNQSINRYLTTELINHCKELYDKFEKIQEKYNPINERYDNLPDNVQDEIAEKMDNAMFNDPNFLKIYESKLELEKIIFNILINIKSS